MAKKKQTRNEEAEIERAYESLAGKKASKKRGKYVSKSSANKSRPLIIAAICIAVFAIVLGIAAGCIYFSGPKDSDLIEHNVTIAGVNLYGMTRIDAINALQLATQSSYGQKEMVITIEGIHGYFSIRSIFFYCFSILVYSDVL